MSEGDKSSSNILPGVKMEREEVWDIYFSKLSELLVREKDRNEYD